MGTIRNTYALEGHDGRVWGISWSPDGTLLASCSGDRTIRLWDTGSLGAGQCCEITCIAVLGDKHLKTVRSVSWSPGGTSLVSASFDGTSGVWRKLADTWQQTAVLEGHENEVKCAVLSPSGSLLATCGRDKTVWVWESFPGDDFECADVKYGHSQDVKMVAWHPSSEVLASASYDNTIKLWKEDPDGSEWNCVQTLEGIGLGHDSTVWSIAYNAGGTHLASASADRTVKVWKCESKGQEPFYKLEHTISGCHSRSIYSVAWSVDGRLATASGDNALRVFSRRDTGWQLDAEIRQAHEQDVNCVIWHPKLPSLLATCSDDGTIKIWSIITSSDQPVNGDQLNDLELPDGGAALTRDAR